MNLIILVILLVLLINVLLFIVNFKIVIKVEEIEIVLVLALMSFPIVEVKLRRIILQVKKILV